MKKILSVAIFFALALGSNAQNTSPYWSLAGNNNATSSSKLGTTNSINLMLFTNNAERVRITTTGDVGIGTTSPSARLHINAAASEDAFRVQLNGVTKLFLHNAGGLAVGGNTVPPSNGLFVSGKVGIGTASPTHTLDVRGEAVFDGVQVGLGNGGISSNTTIGNGALNSNTTGNTNTANGYQTLYTNTTGNSNTASGFHTLYSNTTGTKNTANGYQALYLNSTGNFNTADGYQALNSNTTGSGNVAVGIDALTDNTTGAFNTANGYQTLYFNTTGNVNTAYGIQALYHNTTGAYNTSDGGGALSSNTTGSFNTANGNQALGFNDVGTYNTATGYYALYQNTSGYINTAIGNQVLYSNTSGYGNTAIGNQALYSNTTGSTNTAIGYGADVSSGALTNATAIGANAVVNASNRMQLGSSTTTLATSGGYTIVSDGRFKENVKMDDAPGLAFINKLRPVAYNFNHKRYDDFLRKDIKVNKDSNLGTTETKEYQRQLVEKSKKREVGFIAQEVDQICRDNQFTFNGVYAPQNSYDNYALDYSRFVVPLVKAIQELSSQNDSLKQEINQLKATVYSGSNMNNGIASITVNAAFNIPLLGQNIPNPAANNTIIPFRIPKNCNSASIVISDVGSGRILTAIPVSCSETHLAIDAGTMASGTYNYSLYINGKLVDTKQMVLAK